jgi:DNA polymerase I
MTAAESRPTKLMLIDGHALVHRAFHAVRDDLSTSSGELTNAVFGFTSIVLKEIGDLRPSHVVIAFDRPVPTFRHKEYAEYKAQRPPTPSALVSQFARVRQVAEALHFTIYEVDGFEADDVLGTLSLQADVRDLDTVIVTGDLDAVQLVSDHVSVLTPGRGMTETTVYDEARVRERYGVGPEQIPDWKALVGDTSDNIPGVKGVGAKAATDLLSRYGTVENLYDHLEELKPKQRELLEPARDVAFQGKRLATIIRDVPIELDLSGCAWSDLDRGRLIDLFRELEFRTMIDRVRSLLPSGRQVVAGVAPAPPGRDAPQQLSMLEDAGFEEDSEAASFAATLPLAGIEPERQTDTRVVRTRQDLEDLVASLRAAPRYAVDTETTSTDPLHASLVGLSFATEANRAWYVPVGHVEGEQLPLHEVLDGLRPILEDPEKGAIGHNMKYDLEVLRQHGVRLACLEFDTMIAAYLTLRGQRGISLKDLASRKLGIEMTPIDALIGRGKAQVTMDRVDIDATALYAGADADVTLRLYELLRVDLQEEELEKLFHDIEMPLITVLADMERVGVKLDHEVLAVMSVEMSRTIGELEGRIYELVGRRFNINSTQQLGSIIFGELGMKSGRRTKTGYSTDNEVLERLRGAHPIVDAVLEYRQLIKLRNTYVDALPELRDPQTGRIHTDFNQTIASTGRLSSSNPNLQNIPVRGSLGRTIRRAFVAGSPRNVLLAADYSQIELRILASMSHDERLMHAFLTGEDIHRATAAAVFRVPLSEVTADQRRVAKVVNFGIIYGIGEMRLAHETGITREEAHDFIASYNQTYAGVKAFMDGVRKQAALNDYVQTLLGRRGYYRDIHSTHPGLRAAAERAAVNMPIQGTAADIIKIAMINLHRELGQRYPDAKMVLQVHDELVFDVPRDLVDELAPLVRHEMEHALTLDVPLEVEMKVGVDWYDMSPLDAAA